MKLLWGCCDAECVCVSVLLGAAVRTAGCAPGLLTFLAVRSLLGSGYTNVPPKCDLQQWGCSCACFPTPRSVVTRSGCGGCGEAEHGVNSSGEKAALNLRRCTGPAQSLPRKGKVRLGELFPTLLN